MESGLLACPVGDPAPHVAELAAFADLYGDLKAGKSIEDALVCIQMRTIACMGNSSISALAKSVRNAIVLNSTFNEWNHTLIAQLAHLWPRCFIFNDNAEEIKQELGTLIGNYFAALFAEVSKAGMKVGAPFAPVCMYTLSIVAKDSKGDLKRAARIIYAACQLFQHTSAECIDYYSYVGIAISCWNVGALQLFQDNSSSEDVEEALNVCRGAMELLPDSYK